MYRLNHSILDPPVAVLLHPGLLDNHSSSLRSSLSAWKHKSSQTLRQLLEAPQWLKKEYLEIADVHFSKLMPHY